jgi:hypothetical protein
MEQEANDGSNEIDNAIVLCLRCHAEAGHYNAKHPIGNRYHSDELRRHRDEWWQWCSANPAVMPPKSPVRVSPETIEIDPSKWTRKTIATVYNRSDTPIFQVWVKLTIDGTATFETIDVLPSMSAAAVVLCCGDLKIATKCLGLMGTDAAGKNSLLIRFYGLDPGKNASLAIEDTTRTGDRCQLTLSIVGFDESPPALLENADALEIALPFQIPLDRFVLKGFGFRIAAIESPN